MKALQELLLLKKHKVLIPETTTTPRPYENIRLLMTFQMELLQLGYIMDQQLYDTLRNMNIDTLNDILKQTIDVLMEQKGANRTYTLLYPNFPREVMELSDMELMLNAYIHYWSNGELYPVYQIFDKLRKPLVLEKDRLTTLFVGSIKDCHEIAKHLMASTVSISKTDQEALKTILETMGNEEICAILPQTIPHREIKATVLTILLNAKTPINNQVYRRIYAMIDTPTDILRLYAALSGADPSLAGQIRFKSMPRRIRRKILTLMEDLIYRKGEIPCVKEMLAHKEQWIRLGERLHPGEYETQYPKTNRIFSLLRNPQNCQIRTDNSRLEDALRKKDIHAALRLLTKYPGVLARRIDHLLRISSFEDNAHICNLFKAEISQMPTPLLLTLRHHLEYRDNTFEQVHVYLPKGQTQKAWYDETRKPAINGHFKNRIISDITQELIRRFAKKESWGNVYIDPNLRNITIPKSDRSLSKSLKTLPRGSRISMDQTAAITAKFLRAFIWWTNTRDNDRVDLDLSVGFYNDNFQSCDHVGWDNLRNEENIAILSGDITNGQDFNGPGVAEFLDIDLEKALSAGYRYAVIQIHSYTGQTMAQLEHASFGWMLRDGMRSGKPFEPATVEQRTDLDAPAAISIPTVIDLVTKECIICDISGTMPTGRDNRNQNTLRGTRAAIYACVKQPQENLFRIILEYVASNPLKNSLTMDIQNADIAFTVNPVSFENKSVKNITAYDAEWVKANLLS